MFVDLKTYIKNDFIKRKFMESYISVESMDDAERLARNVYFCRGKNILFENSCLKNRFFAIARASGTAVSVINCDARPERIEEDLDNADGIIILHNINKCADLNILNQVQKDRILIC